MNYYAHHIGDYARDTAHLSMLEDAAYRRLLDVYYSTEQPLPADIATLCRLVRAKTRAEKRAVESVTREFFQLCDGAWRQKRCDCEIAKSKTRIRNSQINGKIGGRPITQQVSESNPVGLPPETQNEPVYQKPITNNQSKPSSAADATRRPPLNGHKIAFNVEKAAFDGIGEQDLGRWQEAYPAISVPDQVERAAAWLHANPANRKSNYERFLVNWFSRAQDRAPPQRRGSP